MLPYDPFLDRLIDLALEEDAGATGDVTSHVCVDPSTMAEAYVLAKEPLVLAGLSAFARVFGRLDETVRIKPLAGDGAFVEKGTIVARVFGNARSLLLGERPALNFLMRLSGVATYTKRMVDALAPFPGTRLVDTRKTTPGWRALEKAAVRAGGGHNHRMGLFDGVLIKDNHILAAGGIPEAVRRARLGVHHLLKIEVECSTLEQVDTALSLFVEALLLDNMDDATMTEAARRAQVHAAKTGRPVVLEASGNMTFERLPKVAQCGVDFISMGALTHGARSVDLSMKLELAT